MTHLTPGSINDEVKALQTALNLDNREWLPVDGIYAQSTIDAVKRAQVRLKEPVNGVAGVAFQLKLGVKPWVEVAQPTEEDKEPKKHKKA